jgi:hypothetical protein
MPLPIGTTGSGKDTYCKNEKQTGEAISASPVNLEPIALQPGVGETGVSPCIITVNPWLVYRYHHTPIELPI